MAKKTAKNTENSAVSVNAQIVNLYRDLVSTTEDTNTANLNFIIFTAEMIQRGEVSAREIRASIESCGKFAIAPVIKASHAEILETACAIILENSSAGASDPLASKVLSLATRVKRAGVEVKAGDTFESLDEKTPSAKEIADAKKTDKVEEVAQVALPALDALVIGFIAEFKKAVKGKDFQALSLENVPTKDLEYMARALSEIVKIQKSKVKA